jgi:hypothetical protein
VWRVYFSPDFGHTFLLAVGFLAAIFFRRAYSAAMTTGVASQAVKAALARLV